MLPLTKGLHIGNLTITHNSHHSALGSALGNVLFNLIGDICKVAQVETYHLGLNTLDIYYGHFGRTLRNALRNLLNGTLLHVDYIGYACDDKAQQHHCPQNYTQRYSCLLLHRGLFFIKRQKPDAAPPRAAPV